MGKVLFALLAAVLVYGGFVIYSGLDQIRDSLQHFHWAMFLAALTLASLNYGLRFCKWQYYLARLGIVQKIRIQDSALIFLSGFMLTITPGKIGEVFKSAVLQKTHGVSKARTAPIVIAERLTDVLGVVVLILVGSTAFGGGLRWAVSGAALVSVAVLLTLWTTPVTWVLNWISTTRLKERVPKLRLAYDSLRQLSDVRSLLVAGGLSVVGWGLEGFALYLLLRGFGCDVSMAHSQFFYSTSTLAGALVPVPGGLGVTEAILHEQMVQIGGVASGDATAAMIMIRFATLWWAVLVGFLAFGLLRLKYPDKLRASATAVGA